MEGLGIQHTCVLCWSPCGLSVGSAGLLRWMLPFRAALQLPSRGCCHFPASLPGDSPLTTASCLLSPLPHLLRQHLSEQALFLLRFALQSFHSCFPTQSPSSLNSVLLVFPFFSFGFFCPVSWLWCKGNAFIHCSPSSRHRCPISMLPYSQSPRLSRRSSAGDPAIIVGAVQRSAADLFH